jgi:hypothetical protein
MTRLLLCALCLACAASAKDGEDLLSEVRLYSEGIRWKKYQDAAARIPPGEREAFLDQREDLEDELHIDDYEIGRVKIRKGKDGALVQVKYTWHLDSLGVVYDTVVEQVWERRGVHWLRTAETRKRGERMPGLEEAPDPGGHEASQENGRRNQPL